MTIHNPLYKMLGNARARRKLTLKQVSEATGIALATYHRIEIGERTLNVESAKILGEFYSIKPAVLLGLEEAHTHTYTTLLQSDLEDVKACKCGAWQLWRYQEDEDQGSVKEESDNA